MRSPLAGEALRLLMTVTVTLMVVQVFFTRQYNPSAATGQFNKNHTLKSHTRSEDAWILDMHKWTPEQTGYKSQGSQDFYIDTIVDKIGGPTNKFFVEFGFNEPGYTTGGSGANTRNLYDKGWRGLLLDGTQNNPDINLHAHYLFASNIASILRQYSVPRDLDFLSCDMDSHDLFVLEGIFQGGFRPRLITTEYNANYPLGMAIAQADPEMLYGHQPKNFSFVFKQCAWGASASAVRILAEKFGYTLVGVVGYLDLVWLRSDLIKPNWHVPTFEWFFTPPAPFFGTLGSDLVFHKQQESPEVFEWLIDYELYSKTKDFNRSRDSARQLLTQNKLKCFEKVV